MLRLISMANPEIPPVIPDGIYGADTMRSVTALQQYAHLPATGVADLATWNEMLSMFNDASEALMPPQPLELRVQPGAKILQGEENLHLYLVQAMFLALGTVFDNVPSVEINGHNDESCTQAIRWLQALSELPVTGELDRSTWRYLTGIYRLAISDGAMP